MVHCDSKAGYHMLAGKISVLWTSLVGAAGNRVSGASTKHGSSYRYLGGTRGGSYQEDDESCGLFIALLAISLSGFRPLVAADLQGAQGDLLLRGEFHAQLTEMMTQVNAGTLRSLLYNALKENDLRALCVGIAAEFMQHQDAKEEASKKKANAAKEANEKKEHEEAAKKKAEAAKKANEKKEQEKAAKEKANAAKEADERKEQEKAAKAKAEAAKKAKEKKEQEKAAKKKANADSEAKKKEKQAKASKKEAAKDNYTTRLLSLKSDVKGRYANTDSRGS
jgi:hypothetical protein